MIDYYRGKIHSIERFEKNEEWWLWESHFHSKKKKNQKDFNTLFYSKTHILIKFLIQASFIKKDSFDVALSCSKRLSGDLEAIQTLKSHENQKWLEINRKRKEMKYQWRIKMMIEIKVEGKENDDWE